MLKLVPEWRKAWRWFSMQSMALVVALLGSWAALPDDLKSGLPGWVVPSVSAAVLFFGMAGRLVKQK